MLYAKILRPPAHGAKLKSVDTAAAKAIAGVQVVQEGDLVAVLHELPDVAEAALEKVKAEFDVPEPTVDDKTIFDHLLKAAPEGRVVAEGGDLEEGRKLAAKTFEQTYLNSYVAHAAIETHTALAKIEGDKATVWASTQNPFGAQREIAEAIGLRRRKGARHRPVCRRRFWRQDAQHAGGRGRAAGQGRRQAGAGGWSRAEEFFYDTFRPAAVVKINSGIDASGKMVFWDYDVFFAGERGARSSIRSHIIAPPPGPQAGRGRRDRIPSPPAPGARRATTPTPLPANRRLTSWRRRRAWTPWSSASRT